MSRDKQAGGFGINRRDFLSLAGAGVVGAAALGRSPMAWAQKAAANRFELSIAPVKVELAPGVVIETVGYNGKVPGPILRAKEGEPVEIHVTNRTDVAELVHWHGLHIDALNDGSSEEGSPVIAPGGELRYRFVPEPSGSRWYHTHTMAHDDFRRAAYSGQYGFFYIEPKNEPGAYDHEVFLAVHHWGASMAHAAPPQGNEVVYEHASFNDRLAGAQEPLRVKEGQRVLFRLLNASATRNVQIALPNHQFRVVALDGNPVPAPQVVNVISLAVAERVDAVVEMKSPGVWMLGAVDDLYRGKGLGLPIEYAGQKGAPAWTAPGKSDWSYALFGNAAAAETPARRVPMVFQQVKAASEKEMDRWTINGKAYPEIAPLQVKKGERIRLSFLNTSAKAHPMHLHRHSFELTGMNGKPISGIFKDVVNVDAYSKLDVDFVANNPGPSLFHCHHQMHMDYGFMQLFEYLQES